MDYKMSWLTSFQYSTLVYKVFALIALAVATKIFLKALKNLLRYFFKKSKVRYRIQDLASLTGGILFMAVVIMFFSQDIKEFAIPFSVIGAGIAFSLQEIITSIAGRITVVSGNLYKIGDRIQIGDMQGDVIDIGFLRTSLMEIGSWVKADQYTGRIIHITNSTVLKDSLINYSATFPFVWDEVVIPVRYGSDQHLARKIILEVTNKITQNYQLQAKETWLKVQERYMIEQSTFVASVTLIANDNWLEFTARYITPFNQRRSIKDKLCSAYVDAFSKTNHKVEYASMTIEITNFPQLSVNLDKA